MGGQRLTRPVTTWRIKTRNFSAEDRGDEKMQSMKTEGHDKEGLWWKLLERSNSKPGKPVSLRQVLKTSRI